MIDFKKWPKITNSYERKFLAGFLNDFPWLEHASYVITEKIHGANIQIAFASDKPYRVGSRHRWLETGDKFNSIWEILARPRYQSLLAEIQQDITYLGCTTLRLYGEIFGGNIQKGVDYGPVKRVRFFGMIQDNVLLPAGRFEGLMQGFVCDEALEEGLMVPVLGRAQDLKAALAFDPSGITLVGPSSEDNIREGIVIQPEFLAATNHNGKHFILKNKNKAFMEKAAAPAEKIEDNPMLGFMRQVFAGYICDNRVQSIFSQYGIIESSEQIGKYIRLVLQDALEDFLQDYPDALNCLNKKERGQVTKAGGKAAGILKRYLVGKRKVGNFGKWRGGWDWMGEE